MQLKRKMDAMVKSKITKSIITFAGIYLFLYIFNSLTPMSTGDDCLYAFIWQGHSMFIPLTEDAVRVTSLRDLFVSQCSLYLTWGGRVVGQTLTQLFVWQGKIIFNILNALAGTLLVAEIYWCSNKGNLNLDFRPGILCWILFALWSFAPGFSDVFFWLTGACIYLWPMVFLLAFLLPYVKKYYALEKATGQSHFFSLVMFFCGVVAGCGNENSICWIILALLLFMFLNRKCFTQETWMYTGLTGLITGYAILMLAPGNMARLTGEHESDWFHFALLKHHVSILLVVLLFQVFMWHFCTKSLLSLRKKGLSEQGLLQDVLMVKVLLVISFGMSAIMLLSPEFPTRSGFPGTIPLLIATCILWRLQKEYNFSLINKIVKKFLFGLCAVYFLITASVSTFNFYEKNNHMNEILTIAQQQKESSVDGIVCVKPFREVSFRENLLSGLHIPTYNFTEEVNSWGNVAFARYYGIKGIKVEK